MTNKDEKWRARHGIPLRGPFMEEIETDEIVYLAKELMFKLFEERKKIRRNKHPHLLGILMEEHTVIGYQIALMQSMDKILTADSYAIRLAGVGLLEATITQIQTCMGWKE